MAVLLSLVQYRVKFDATIKICFQRGLDARKQGLLKLADWPQAALSIDKSELVNATNATSGRVRTWNMESFNFQLEQFSKKAYLVAFR